MSGGVEDAERNFPLRGAGGAGGHGEGTALQRPGPSVLYRMIRQVACRIQRYLT